MSKRIALYLRVSTAEQTVENQQRELEAVAERHGWNVVAVFTDAGISGTKGRDKRPGYDCLCRGIARREFDQVAAWSVDRLGRSLQELVAFLGELHAKGVDLYLHQQGIDTGTPAGNAMFQMLGVFAEFERAMIVGSRLAFHVHERKESGSGVARYAGKLSIASARSWRPARVFSKPQKRSASAREPCIGSNERWWLQNPERCRNWMPTSAQKQTDDSCPIGSMSRAGPLSSG
jgi:DNA invertase Pin-like site-specific DNA recombinase